MFAHILSRMATLQFPNPNDNSDLISNDLESESFYLVITTGNLVNGLPTGDKAVPAQISPDPIDFAAPPAKSGKWRFSA